MFVYKKSIKNNIYKYCKIKIIKHNIFNYNNILHNYKTQTQLVCLEMAKFKLS